MKLTLEFLNTRIQQLGSRCEPVTSVEDRNGYKPQGEFLHKAGLRLADINHKGEFVEFKMVEKTGEGIAIRDFSYSKAELDKGIELLETSIGSEKAGYATEWNWLQFSRAKLLIEAEPKDARIAIMRDQAAQAPMRVGGNDAHNDGPALYDIS